MPRVTVNLRWRKQVRGLLPATANSVTDDGRVLLIHPDEAASRCYRLEVIDSDPDGAVLSSEAVSVETLRKLDGSPDHSLLAAITHEDLYLFDLRSGGRKTRFNPGRRVNYGDVALAPPAGRFACGMASELLAGSAVAAGDASGRALWSLDLDTPVNRVAITRDAELVAAGMQDGRVLLLDGHKHPRWEHAQPEAVTALALPEAGSGVVVGTEGSTLLALDEEGALRWRAPLRSSVTAVATDAAMSTIAAIHAEGLGLFGRDGEQLWEYDPEQSPMGVSLSPSGRYLLVTQKDGVALLFEIERASAGTVGEPVERRLGRVRDALGAGDLPAALTLASLVVRDAPHRSDAAELLEACAQRAVAALRDEAACLEAAGDYAAALERLSAAQAADPWSIALFQERLGCRDRALEALRERAGEHEAAADWEAAEETCRSLLGLHPFSVEARQGLVRARSSRVEALSRRADSEFTVGNLRAAIECWRGAQELSPSNEAEERLRNAETELAVRTGVELYQNGRLPEAVFHLRKALALTPGHQEAQRYLGYAEAAHAGDPVGERFSRLE